MCVEKTRCGLQCGRSIESSAAAVSEVIKAQARIDAVLCCDVLCCKSEVGS